MLKQAQVNLKKTIFLLILFVFYGLSSFSQNIKKYQKNFLLMGSSFEIAVITESEKEADTLISLAYKEIVRIENLISSWKEDSETALINVNAGVEPTKVSIELYNLIRRAKKISELSEGAFDISFASINKLWYFDGSMNKIPSEEEVKKSIEKINYKNIELNEEDHSVFLTEKGMRIGFGAIGKGYAANSVKKMFIELGVKNGMINAGGDLIAWGDGLNGEKWKVGIANPDKKKGAVSWLQINDMAVVTSGNYEKFVIIDGVKYAHIIDPRTGYPARGLKSVTIICPDAELADALATTVFVLGQQKGLDLINKLNAVECVIINDNDDIITSKTLKLNML